jgi:hypothetical protein
VIAFSYWDRPDQSPIADFLAEWRSHFPDFQILDDRDVEEMLREDFPESVGLFRRIRIPTCKSDIAILIGLYRQGGLYVDCHCGIRDADGLNALLDDAHEWELVLYDLDRTVEPRPPDVPRPLNSVMVAQPNSAIIRRSAALALQNLHVHWELERQTTTHVFYDIWTMTGPGVLEHTVCIPPAEMWGLPRGIRPENVNKVRFVQEGPDAPIIRYRHYSYSPPEEHWSRRQKTERLFSDEPTPDSRSESSPSR